MVQNGSFIHTHIYIYIYIYGCEAWSLTAREERKLKVFGNMVFRRIFGPRRNEVMEEIA